MGSLQTQDKGKTYRLKLGQSEEHYDYLIHLCDTVFSRWILSPPKKYIRVDAQQRKSIYWGTQTISHSSFNVLHPLFFESNLAGTKKSIVRSLVQKHLSAQGLAYWFMDDGGRLAYGTSQSKGVVFNSHSFSKEDVTILADILRQKFNLDTRVKMNKKKHIVA